jgi:hypothetical protein
VQVGIEHLHVMITHDDGSWFAQGMEVDYFTEGTSLKDVKKRFENGLEATVDLHLKAFGTAKKLFSPAPDEVWVEYLDSVAEGKLFAYSQATFHTLPARFSHRFPFSNIQYYTREKRAA